MKVGESFGWYWNVPNSLKVTCQICHYSDSTGREYEDKKGVTRYPFGDFDSNIHEGFTIGNGKTLYWMMIWHGSGHVTVFSKDEAKPRWIPGDTEITIHFKATK